MQTASQATPFDTLTAAKHLQEAGVAVQQAEAIVHVVSQGQGSLATKSDITALKNDITAVKTDITAVKTVIETLATKAELEPLATKAELKIGLVQLKYDMTIRFGVMLATAIGVIKALDKLL